MTRTSTKKAETTASEEKKTTTNEQATTETKETEMAALEKQNKMLLEQLEGMKRQIEALSKPQVIQVQTEQEKKVHFLWQAEVADNNVIDWGRGGVYGKTEGKTGEFFVPKSELSQILDSTTRNYLKWRWLIVLDGLDDLERVALGVDYKEGEILDRTAFSKMIELGPKLLEIYPNLCDGHKLMVAKRCLEAYELGNKNVTRELVTALNEMSRSELNSNGGDFLPIIDKMNDFDARR